MEFTRPSTANRTYDRLRLCGWEATDHHPYSTDLVPRYFHLFVYLKEHLAGKRFAADADMKQVVAYWIQTLDIDFFYAGMRALVPRWTKLTSKCQRWLHGRLMCTTCSPFSLCRLHRIQNKFIDIRVFVILLLEVFLRFCHVELIHNLVVVKWWCWWWWRYYYYYYYYHYYYYYQ